MEDLNVQTIAIPVEEYKELIQKQAELSLIYHKGAGGSVYDIGNFVLDACSSSGADYQAGGHRC